MCKQAEMKHEARWAKTIPGALPKLPVAAAGQRDQRDNEQVYREERGVTTVQPRFIAPRRGIKRTDVTMAELATHSKRDDCWVCIEGHAYDLTKYIDRHPGGWLPIQNMAGRDATDVFANYHPAQVYKRILPSMHVGRIADYKVSSFVRGHRALRQELLRHNLFETDWPYYARIAIWQGALFLGALALACAPLVLEVSDAAAYRLRMCGAALLGLFWQQFAFVGHDIGHNGVSHVRSLDYGFGAIVGNLLGGISISWWKRSHNVHHIVCNSVEHDPDIQHCPLFAIDRKIFGRFWSTYHEKFVSTDAVTRALVSVQHFLFYPVMAVARFNLYAQSWILLLSSADYRKGGGHFPFMREAAPLVLFAAWMSGLVWSFDTHTERLHFLLLSHAIAGVLHVQICISHFTMDTYRGHAYNDDTDEWFRMQLATTMNVACPTYMDWFHGGLQFQIEHHLWPRLPRHNLRHARELVTEFCKKHDVHYHEPGFWAANKELVATLHRTATVAAKLDKGDGGFYESILWDGINAQG